MKNTKMLKKNHEFGKVFSRGKYYSGEFIEAFILNNFKNENYLGLAISSKSGHAVQRNRIKRLLRENFIGYEENLILGLSIVFLVKKKADIKEIDYNMVKKDMKIIFKKAKVLKES